VERQTLELRDVAGMLSRHKLLVAFVLAAFLAGSIVYTTTAPERYAASTRLLLLPVAPGSSLRSLGGTGPGGPLGLDMEASTQAQIVDSPMVAARVARSLRVDATPPELAGMVEVRSGETQVLQIDATAGRPRLAAAVANGFAREYVAYRRELTAATLDTLTRDSVARKARLDREIKEVDAEIAALRAGLPSPEAGGLATPEPPESPEARRLDELTAERESLAEQRTAIRQRDGELRATTQSIRHGGGQIIQRAVPDLAPVRPKAARDIPVGLLAGLLVALVAVFALEYLDDRVRSRGDVEAGVGAPVLAVVPRLGLLRRSRRRPLLQRRESGASVYAFRRLRARLLAHGVVAPQGTVVAASVDDDEETAVAVVRLAVAFARANFRTLILSLDVRHHRVEQLLDLQRPIGLTDVLMDHRPFASVTSPTGLANLLVVPAGSGKVEDTDLFASTRLRHVLDQASQLADLVLVEAPAESTGGDLAVLASQVDGSLVMAKSGVTSQRALRATLNELRAAGKPVLGVVLADRAHGRGGHHAARRPGIPRLPAPDAQTSRPDPERAVTRG
jgi:capsular polysaccharide biosynthesis protein/Mrp family chromosome partitioning ATPase